jgi:glycosyltransferase involved in cell wall biosynthesis
MIRVGLTERHGMALEFSRHPAEDIAYAFLSPAGEAPVWLRSPIKGYLRCFEAGDNDLVESILSPILTRSRWIYSCANFQEATAFSVLGLPTPRSLRVAYISRLLLQENCRGFILWSEAGRETLASYGGVRNQRLLDKTSVVYPAVGKVDDALVQRRDAPASLLFSGDFFRKGGVNVLDAFARLRVEFPEVTLTLCCDEKINFRTGNAALRDEYLAKIRNTPGVNLLGMVPRDRLLNEILPRTDIYLLPTYVETFGFAILEAMAYGIPVIATNYFAIPEMVQQGSTGFLIDTARFDCERLFRGYVVDQIPSDFRAHVTNELYRYLRELVASPQLRRTMGAAALSVARTTFSVERRNEQMAEIYRKAAAP